MLDMLSAEKHMLSRHHAKNTLKRGQAERLNEVRKIITALEKKIPELTAAQAEAQPPVAQPGAERQPTDIVAPPSSATRKRKAAAQTTATASKKQSTTLVVSARRRNKGNAAKESTELILNLLQNQDVFAAGWAMADLPVLAEFDATTWKDQDKHFRDVASNGPGADKKKDSRRSYYARQGSNCPEPEVQNHGREVSHQGHENAPICLPVCCDWVDGWQRTIDRRTSRRSPGRLHGLG